MRPLREALFYELDGSLNLTWILLLIFAAMGLVTCGVALVAQPHSATVVIGVLAFLNVGILTFTISAVPIARAKILADSPVLAEAASVLKGLPLDKTPERLPNDERD